MIVINILEVLKKKHKNIEDYDSKKSTSINETHSILDFLEIFNLHLLFFIYNIFLFYK